MRLPAKLRPLVPAFLENRAKDLGLAQDALAQGDWGTLAAIGHRTFGTASSYGFAGLGDIARRLEHAAGAQDRALVQACLTAWGEYLQQVEIDYASPDG